MNALDILKETAKKFPEAPASGRLVSVHQGKTCYCLLGRIGNVSGMSDAELTIGSLGGDGYKGLRDDGERFKAITALADEINAHHPGMTSHDPISAVYTFNDRTLDGADNPTPESVKKITEVVEAAALRLARAEAAHLRTKLAEIEDDLADDLFDDDAHHDEEPPEEEEDTQPIGLILVPVSAAADPNATVIRSARIVTDGPSFVGDLVLEAVEAGLIPATEEACLVIHPTTAVMWRVNIEQASKQITTITTDYNGVKRAGSITEVEKA